MSDENNAEHEVSNIMKELQPIAFLFSVCMVVAAFYANNEVNKTDLANILMASLFFFFAYIGLFFSKKTDFRWFMYFGEFSLALGAIYVYKSLVGIAKIIDQAAIDTNSLWIYIVLYSFFLILFMYLSNKVKNEGIYFCKIFFHMSLVLFCLYVILFGLRLVFQYSGYIRALVSISLQNTVIVCLVPMFYFYLRELNLFNTKKVTSLGEIANLIIGTSLVVIGFGLLTSTPSMFYGVVAIFIFGVMYYHKEN